MHSGWSGELGLIPQMKLKVIDGQRDLQNYEMGQQQEEGFGTCYGQKGLPNCGMGQEEEETRNDE